MGNILKNLEKLSAGLPGVTTKIETTLVMIQEATDGLKNSFIMTLFKPKAPNEKIVEIMPR